jgi:hypothetical protein
MGTVEVYCDLQTQRSDLLILDRSVYGRLRISFIELKCPWDTDAHKAKDCKISRYAGLEEELSYKVWDCGLYKIEFGAWGHISEVVKDHLWSLFRSWVPPGHRSGVAQMIKYANWISLVYSFSIFQARNDPVWIFPRLVSHHIDGVLADK